MRGQLNGGPVGASLAVLVVAGLAEGLPALPEDDRKHGQGADRVGPPPAEQGIEADAGQQGQGEIGADPGLGHVGDQGTAAHLAAGALLPPSRRRHDQQRQHAQDQPYDGSRFFLLLSAVRLCEKSVSSEEVSVDVIHGPSQELSA